MDPALCIRLVVLCKFLTACCVIELYSEAFGIEFIYMLSLYMCNMSLFSCDCSYNVIAYKDRPHLRTALEILRTTQEIERRLEEV